MCVCVSECSYSCSDSCCLLHSFISEFVLPIDEIGSVDTVVHSMMMCLRWCLWIWYDYYCWCCWCWCRSFDCCCTPCFDCWRLYRLMLEIGLSWIALVVWPLWLLVMLIELCLLLLSLWMTPWLLVLCLAWTYWPSHGRVAQRLGCDSICTVDVCMHLWRDHDKRPHDDRSPQLYQLNVHKKNENNKSIFRSYFIYFRAHLEHLPSVKWTKRHVGRLHIERLKSWHTGRVSSNCILCPIVATITIMPNTFRCVRIIWTNEKYSNNSMWQKIREKKRNRENKIQLLALDIEWSFAVLRQWNGILSCLFESIIIQKENWNKTKTIRNQLNYCVIILILILICLFVAIKSKKNYLLGGNGFVSF